jgi:hypothetical protein
MKSNARSKLLIKLINSLCDDLSLESRYRALALDVAIKCSVIGTKNYKDERGKYIYTSVQLLAEAIVHCAIQHESRYTCPITTGALHSHKARKLDIYGNFGGVFCRKKRPARTLNAVRSITGWKSRDEPVLPVSVIKDLGLTKEEAEEIRSSLRNWKAYQMPSGCSKVGIAAAITYLYLKRCSKNISQETVAQSFHINTVTLRERSIEICRSIDSMERVTFRVGRANSESKDGL